MLKLLWNNNYEHRHPIHEPKDDQPVESVAADYDPQHDVPAGQPTKRFAVNGDSSRTGESVGTPPGEDAGTDVEDPAISADRTPVVAEVVVLDDHQRRRITP